MTKTQSLLRTMRVHSVLALMLTCFGCSTEDSDKSDLEILDIVEDSADATTWTSVTDLNSGLSIEIRRVEGGSLITDLATGESIRVEGDFTDMTDEEYTEMMLYKAELEASTPYGAEPHITTSPLHSGSVSYGFYVTGGTGGFDTPKQYVNGSSLALVVSQQANVTTLSVTLYRYRSFWWNENLGTKSYSGAGPVSKSWSVTSGKEYIANVTRSSTTVGTTGTISLVW